MRMPRIAASLAGLFAVLIAPGAVSQPAPTRIQRPPLIRVAPPDLTAQPASPNSDVILQSPEAMREAINRLRREKRALRDQLALSVADLQALRIRVDEMTRVGGSLVTAQCVSRILSRNTAGAEESCDASGYSCSEVSGQCHRACTASSMCAPGYACNVGNQRCEPPQTD